MRSTSIISLFVAALCTCVAAAGPSEQSNPGDITILSVGEPDDLITMASGDPTNVWVPAENIAATWESVTLMSKLYNPAAKSATQIPERSLSLSARVDVVDVNGLLGFDSAPRGKLVLDGKLSVICSEAAPSRYCHFYWPLRYQKKMSGGQWVSELQPYNLTVDVPLDPNRPYPTLLSRVEWSMYVLVNTEVKTVDVPFSPTADWLTLVPGLEIKVEKTTVDSGKYDYRIATRYSHSKVLWATSGAAISIWTQDPTPEVILTKLDVLDPQEKSIQDQGNGSFSGGGGAGGSGDLVTGTYSGNGSCDICGTATKFRFTLALKPQQQQLRFILENVPVPMF